jgi:hypothetical protein
MNSEQWQVAAVFQNEICRRVSMRPFISGVPNLAITFLTLSAACAAAEPTSKPTSGRLASVDSGKKSNSRALKWAVREAVIIFPPSAESEPSRSRWFWRLAA